MRRQGVIRWLRFLLDCLFVVSGLAVVGGIAWMSRQPDAEVFERLASTPVLGSPVRWLRSYYLPSEAEPEPSRAARRRGAFPATVAATPGIEPPRESVWIGIGAALRETPEARGTQLGLTVELSNYPVLERRGSWVRIPVDPEREAWVDLAAERDRTPPLGNAPIPVTPVAARPPDPQRLTLARAQLEPPIRTVQSAGYQLLTDVRDEALVDRLASALEELELVYARRTGLEPIGRPAETIVLLRTEAAYRTLQDTEPFLLGVGSAGHASSGVVALFAGNRDERELLTTLVHEVAHLLNRRAIGPALPPWLEEGLADDIALLELSRRSGGDPYTGSRTVSGSDVRYVGALAALSRLLDDLAAGRLLPLPELLTLSQQEFYAALDRTDLYNQSGFFVHYLFARGERPGRSGGFRSYLRSVAGGGSAEPEALLAALGSSWRQLELEFRGWLLLEGARAGLS